MPWTTLSPFAKNTEDDWHADHNDTVGLQMRRFIQGYISIERMIEELRFHTPAVQYFFGTEKAVGYLKRIP